LNQVFALFDRIVNYEFALKRVKAFFAALEKAFVSGYVHDFMISLADSLDKDSCAATNGQAKHKFFCFIAKIMLIAKLRISM
jgi:hypothetical protein